MSEQPTPPQGTPDDARSEDGGQMLRFSCTACGSALTAPRSAAGVVAPCPKCGVDARAPMRPIEPRRSAPEPPPRTRPASMEAGSEAASATPTDGDGDGDGGAVRPVVPHRGVETGSASPAPAATAPAGRGRGGEERRRRRRTRGSISPVTALSSDYEERKEVGTLIRIILAVALTAAIVYGVFYFLEKTISGPPQPRVSTLVPEP